MRVLRGRASIFASVALTWQIFAVMLVPTAACCQTGAASAAEGDMANCPMHHSTPDTACPMHTQANVDHDCHCPKLGCDQTDNGFMALMGPIGVLPAPTLIATIVRIGQAPAIAAPSSDSLSPSPAAPPPRA